MDAPADAKVLVIMGSVRAARHCPVISAWIVQVGLVETGLDIELVDLADWTLPMDDEAAIPATGVYSQPHTQAWSAKIAQASAIAIVSPQYNWGYPAALKNAIDHCYNEWRAKPLLIVTYGGHAGNKCAAQLLQVAEALKMRPTPTMPGITLTSDISTGGRSIRRRISPIRCRRYGRDGRN